MKKWIVWVLVIALLGGGGYGVWRWRSAHAVAPIQYKTANAEKRRVVAKVTASGTLSALVTVLVGSQVSGRIQKLYVNYNSTVKKGDPVAKIDPQLFQAALAQSQANYDEAKANVVKAQSDSANADKQLARQKALHDEGLAAQQDLDAAESNATSLRALIDVAKANLEQAQASLHQAQVNLSYTSISSPIDGVVISRSVDVGQTVAASLSAPTLFTIAQDLRKMQVDTNVSEGDVGRLAPGQDASFTVDAFPGQKFKGTIGEIRNSATTVQNVVTYDAVIRVDNDDLKLRPGMTANVTVNYADKRDALAVPNAALRFRPIDAPAPTKGGGGGASGRDGGGGGGSGGHHGRDGGGGGGGASGAPDNSRTVYRVSGTNAEPVSIVIGISDGSYTEVVSGDLKEGDPLATDTIGGPTPAPAPTGGGGKSGAPRMF